MTETSGIIQDLRRAHEELDREMKAKYDRSVPFGDLVQDRWARGTKLGFGKNSNIYDSSVVLGPVKVGENCWIGPFTYIDGSGGLTLGDYVTVGVGTMIATHSTVLRDLSAGLYPMQTKPVVIGNRVFIAPQCVIEMGCNIGDNCVVMAHSVVKQSVLANTVVSGNPARTVGKIVFNTDGRPDIRFNRYGLKLFAPESNDT
jgi:acetyltransferase-like isoleucine patch superfamily enzyme